jgi:hypothetical protein
MPWPEDEIMDYTKTHLMRTTQTMQAVISDARAMRLAADGEKHLQNYGLRDVDVSCTYTFSLSWCVKINAIRMYFGGFPTLIHIVHCPGIAYMLIIWACLVITFGLSL